MEPFKKKDGQFFDPSRTERDIFPGISSGGQIPKPKMMVVYDRPKPTPLWVKLAWLTGGALALSIIGGGATWGIRRRKRRR